MNHRRQGWESERKKRQEWEIKSEREKDRKRDRGSREIERKTVVGERDRGSYRERKIKRKIGVGGRETGMGERTIK